MPIRTPRTFALVAVLGCALAQPSSAAEYLERFSGDWTGGGTVRTDSLPAPVNVSCDASGAQEAENSFTLGGTCTALLVLRRDIGADLTLDPESGVYTGTYTGSESGPAELQGTEEDGELRLTVTWGREIFGDDVAEMIIRNEGDDAFTMRVIDEIDGEDVTVSDLSFTRG